MTEEAIPPDVTPLQRKILVELLIGGNSTPRNLEKWVDTDPSYISTLCGDLEEKGFVRDKGRGNYQLTIDGVGLARAIIANARDDEGEPDPRSFL